LAGLILAAVGMSFTTVYFFESQRLSLIDQRIADSSNALLASSEFGSALAKPEIISENITKVLKGRRIGHIFLLKDASGKELYKSVNAGLIDAQLPTFPEWNGVETADEYVRYRNVRWPGTDLTLQVAFVVDRGFIDWQLFDYRVVAYIAGIVLVLFAVSVILTLILLSPLRHLIRHLEEATSNLINLRDVRPLPSRLTSYGSGFWATSDEFSSLISTMRKLIDRINLNYKLTRSWTLQMAHELKTPLAILRAETEGKSRGQEIPQSYAEDVFVEIDVMSNTISRFLDWAELESSQMRDDLHAIHVHQAVSSAAGRLEKIAPNRINLNFQSSLQVIANPMHLDQMITNLLTNAIKYSPATTPVEVTLSGQALSVRDYGAGIPAEVRERIGQPFNVGHNKAGNGLGLAWVATVAKLYQWGLEVRSDAGGTEATVRFPFE